MNRTKNPARLTGNFTRLKLSSDTRAVLNDLLTEAPRLGLDPESVAAAGLPGLRGLLALKLASESTSKAKRDAHLAQLQGTLGVLQYRRHPALVQQLQARAMALQGRGGDTEVAHVTVGEIVLPRALQTRAVLAALGQAAGEAGIPLAHLRVGSGQNSLNPRTGQPEFFDDSDEDSSADAAPRGANSVSPRAGTTKIAAASPTNPSHVDAFFDANRDRITDLANEMDVPPNFLLGLSAYESGWGRPKGQNNLFGTGDSTGKIPLDYATPDAAIDDFRRSQWYSRLQGKTNPNEFAGELLSDENGKKKYNTKNSQYGQKIHDMIDTVNRRLPIWEQRR